ncbi:hypothetical protein D3W54_01090 [Komagataeibacter medellinensis]|uniref:Uncharacterized protein n=1 Tax=Komagataeibacter medellinensis TaxID=1177712 RepID=A0ABQ6VS70_9PROT|nr:hypothetical protein D3W54_01090 [Komagataeibacter medellinensis]
MSDTMDILLIMGKNLAVSCGHLAIRPWLERHDLHIRLHCSWPESVRSNEGRFITIVVMGIFW